MPKLTNWKWPHGQCTEGTINISGVNTLCRRLPFAPTYFVTPNGAIISLTGGIPKWLTPSQLQSGKRVHLIINKRSKSFRIEELVAYCYLNWRATDKKPMPIDGNWNNTHRDNLTIQPKSTIQRARQIRAQRIETLFVPSIHPALLDKPKPTEAKQPLKAAIQLPLNRNDDHIRQKQKFVEQVKKQLADEINKDAPDYAAIKSLTSALAVSKKEIEQLQQQSSTS